MYARCTINDETVPVSELRLTEGYNEGWTFTAVFPRLYGDVTDVISLELNDDVNTIDLTMEPEALTEDTFGLELTGRDRATRRLSHSMFDSSRLHCVTAYNALNAVCTEAGVSCGGSVQTMNIHYGGTEEQESLTLLNSLLDTVAGYYTSNGTTLTFAQSRTSANISLTPIAGDFSVDFDAYTPGIVLTKVTPCDVNTTINKPSGTSSIALGTQMRAASFSCSYHDNRWSGSVRNTDSIGSADLPGGSTGQEGTITIIGVSQSACPTGYDLSFSSTHRSGTGTAWPTAETRQAQRISTHWPTRAAALANGDYYLWLENRNHSTARVTIPLRLAIRTGDVFNLRETNYRITAVTHSMNPSGASTEIEASAI